MKPYYPMDPESCHERLDRMLAFEDERAELYEQIDRFDPRDQPKPQPKEKDSDT
jgi:hypothetical protein